jgi:hypothetical protein
MYVLGSKFDHKLAHHLTYSNKALDSVLLLAKHDETLFTCEETTHCIERHNNYKRQPHLYLRNVKKGTHFHGETIQYYKKRWISRLGIDSGATIVSSFSLKQQTASKIHRKLLY